MSTNSISPSTTSPSTTTTNLEPIDLLTDFRNILGLFDRENQIYNTEINIPSTLNSKPTPGGCEFSEKVVAPDWDTNNSPVLTVLNDAVDTIHANDYTLFNNISRKLNELKHTLNNISNEKSGQAALALDKSGQATLALDKSGQATLALDKSGQATLALDKSGQATLALDKSGQATLALDKSGQATLALDKSITANKPNANTTNTTSTTTRQLTDYLCQICLDAPRDCLLEPCMHFCLCARCVNQLPESKCPVCRRPIDFYQNVFIS